MARMIVISVIDNAFSEMIRKSADELNERHEGIANVTTMGDLIALQLEKVCGAGQVVVNAIS